MIKRSAMKAQDPSIVQTKTVLHKIGVDAWCKLCFTRTRDHARDVRRFFVSRYTLTSRVACNIKLLLKCSLRGTLELIAQSSRRPRGSRSERGRGEGRRGNGGRGEGQGGRGEGKLLGWKEGTQALPSLGLRSARRDGGPRAARGLVVDVVSV